MAHTTAEWIAAVAKIRGYVKTYLGLKTLTPHQQESLQIDLGTLDKDLAELSASLQAADAWKAGQDAAIAAQKAAHAALANGTEGVTGAPNGYNRAQTLDLIAIDQNVLASGTFLPNSDGPGLTFTSASPRNPVPQKELERLAAEIADLTAAGGYTADEIAEADARLAGNLANGISLQPSTAESV
jgi:hypothetical protein